VEIRAETSLPLAVCLSGNVGCSPLVLDLVPDPVGVIGLVSKDDLSLLQTGQQLSCRNCIMGFACGNGETDRQAVGEYPDALSHIDHAAVCLSGTAPARGEIRMRARSPGCAAPSLGRHMNPISSAIPSPCAAVTTVRQAAFASWPCTDTSMSGR